jgi:hypothetical protein
MIPNFDSSVTTPPALSSDLLRTQTQTAHLDAMFRPIYEQNKAVLSVYVGFENGFFRSYPGKGEIRRNGPYDPRQRPWYIDAKRYTAATTSSLSSSTSAAFIVTNPYLDSAGRGWTLTTATVIKDPTTSQILGVAAVDSTLSELSSILQKQFTVSKAQVSIYTNNAEGLAIANPKLADLVNSPSSSSFLGPFTYRNSTGPVITEQVWKEVILKSADEKINTKTASFESLRYNVSV